MTVTQTEKAPLERFRDAVGTGYIYGPLSRSSRPAHHKPCYSFRVSKRDEVISCLLKLWPYLTEQKRGQALGALDRCLERLDVARDAHERGPCHQGHPVEFTVFDKRGFRNCRLCMAAWKREQRRVMRLTTPRLKAGPKPKKVCARGHDDWGLRGNGRRYCLACNRDRARI